MVLVCEKINTAHAHTHARAHTHTYIITTTNAYRAQTHITLHPRHATSKYTHINTPERSGVEWYCCCRCWRVSPAGANTVSVTRYGCYTLRLTAIISPACPAKNISRVHNNRACEGEGSRGKRGVGRGTSKAWPFVFFLPWLGLCLSAHCMEWLA